MKSFASLARTGIIHQPICRLSAASFFTRADPNKASSKSHSSQLTDSKYIYELHEHKFKSGHFNEFEKAYNHFLHILSTKTTDAELVGAFRAAVGDVDSTIHIIRYKSGYSGLDKTIKAYINNDDLLKSSDELGKLCRSREVSVLRAFSFWGDPGPRDPHNIYDLRRYVLKPGQMIEWANNWVKGINYRKEANQNVGGWFTQIGELYVVYHLWAYESLVARAVIRENSWSKEGWDKTVAYTVPLIQKMKSQILYPLDNSPLQ